MSACLTHIRTDSTPYPRCAATRCTVPCSVPNSARNIRTFRTAAAFSSDEYRVASNSVVYGSAGGVSL